MMAAALPSWHEHAADRKSKPLDAVGTPPEPVVRRFLAAAEQRIGRSRSELRVLDVGCGHGARVSWLLSEGWDAWGADIVEEYLHQGVPFIETMGHRDGRLRLIGSDGRLPFCEPFDIVLSHQVLEHVESLSTFARNLAVAGRVGTLGLHVFPAPWKPIEPHMKTPFVHWLPKGAARRRAIKLVLRLGLSVDHFKSQSLDERAEIFSRFSESETFYRSQRALLAAFREAGLEGSFRRPTTHKLRNRLPGATGLLAPVLAAPYSMFVARYFETRQIAVPVE